MTICKNVRNVSATAILAVAMGMGGMSVAAQNNKKPAPAPARPAPAAAPAPRPAAPAPRPAGNPGGGAGTTYTTAPRTTTTSSPRITTTSEPRTTNAMTPRTTTTPAPRVMPPPTSHPAITTPTPRASVDHATRSGSAVRTRSDGRVSDVHDAKRGMDVHHELNGNRRVSVERADHSRLVMERGRPGYVQRGYSYHGHDFGRRSYYYHGREYDRFYRGYGYRGMYLNVYAPGYYFAPGFYGWAYNPWGMPIAYAWGWGGSPWYGYYGGYFAPYATYPSASYWLTDYMISQDLQTAYSAHQEAGEVDGAPGPAGGPAELTPDVKQQIADEVRSQLALENSEAGQNAQHQDVDPASSGIARLLADGRPHVFVAGSALDLVDANGQECAISDGDVLALRTPPAADATAADLVVMASKGGKECQKSSTVAVQLTDLQEMQNHMRETIDQGLQDLQAKQGKGGVPQAPPSAQAKPTETEFASIAPPPDPKDAADLQQQGQQADQSEKEVAAEASQESGTPISVAPPAPATVEIGQTLDQVQAALGTPARVANLGPKVIYYYDGKKVIFKDGKVSDVQ